MPKGVYKRRPRKAGKVPTVAEYAKYAASKKKQRRSNRVDVVGAEFAAAVRDRPNWVVESPENYKIMEQAAEIVRLNTEVSQQKGWLHDQRSRYLDVISQLVSLAKEY